MTESWHPEWVIIDDTLDKFPSTNKAFFVLENYLSGSQRSEYRHPVYQKLVAMCPDEFEAIKIRDALQCQASRFRPEWSELHA